MCFEFNSDYVFYFFLHFFTNNNRTLSRFFATVFLTAQLGFYLFKGNNRNTENIGT